MEGNLIFADRGVSVSEEINFLAPNEADVDFGWPFFEGTTPVVLSGRVTYRGAATAFQGQSFGDVRGARLGDFARDAADGNAT